MPNQRDLARMLARQRVPARPGNVPPRQAQPYRGAPASPTLMQGGEFPRPRVEQRRARDTGQVIIDPVTGERVTYEEYLRRYRGGEA